MKNKTLPPIRIEELTYQNIIGALKKYNQNNLAQMSVQEFRRLSYEFLAQMIIQDKPLPLKLSHE